MYRGSKVQLREYRKEDISKVITYLNNPTTRRNMTPGIPYPYLLHDEDTWFSSQSALKDAYNFAIESIDTNTYLGGIGINGIDWKNSHCMVGIFIGEEKNRGMGYGTDAMKILSRFIFEQLNLHKIKLDVFSYNKQAIASYQKSGFTEEAVFKEELFRDGRYHDIHRMVLFSPIK